MTDNEKDTGRRPPVLGALGWSLFTLGLVLLIPILAIGAGIILIAEGSYLWGAMLFVLGILAGIGPFYRSRRSSK